MRVLISDGASFVGTRLAKRYVVDRDEVTDQGDDDLARAGRLPAKSRLRTLPDFSLNLQHPDC